MIYQEQNDMMHNKKMINDTCDITAVMAIMCIIFIGFFLATSDRVLSSQNPKINVAVMQDIPGETTPLPLPLDSDPAQFLHSNSR